MEDEAGIAVIDLDDFKLHNDTYGHSAGDAALITTANIIKKYIWKTEEDFSLFQKSIFACASQILEEVERKKQIYKSERLRIKTLAALVYLLAQQFLDSTALLKELGQEQKADAEGNRIFLVPAMLELTGNIQAAEGEVISPKRLTKHRLYVKNSQGEELGYLSFRDDCMYYVVIPLMEPVSYTHLTLPTKLEV